MSESHYVETHHYQSKCPLCGKFLTRSMVRIQILGGEKTQVDEVRRAVAVTYGSQTKCHRCKKIRQTEKVAEVNGEDLVRIAPKEGT